MPKKHKPRSPEILAMLLARKDGPHHNRTQATRKGSSRKVKHKSKPF
jgi:hypothetical protein